MRALGSGRRDGPVARALPLAGKTAVKQGSVASVARDGAVVRVSDTLRRSGTRPLDTVTVDSCTSGRAEKGGAQRTVPPEIPSTPR